MKRPDADAALLALVAARGGKSLAVTPEAPARRPVAASARLAAGTLVVAFDVPGRAVPWKAPTVTRRGTFKDARLVEWQLSVRRWAERAMGGAAPYPHPVKLEVTFLIARRSGKYADLSNLRKAAEDGLNGIVYVDDTQVVADEGHKIICQRDITYIAVYAYDPPEDHAR